MLTGEVTFGISWRAMLTPSKRCLFSRALNSTTPRRHAYLVFAQLVLIWLALVASNIHDPAHMLSLPPLPLSQHPTSLHKFQPARKHHGQGIA